MFSRNFCQKSVRENFCNFHTVRVLQCGKYLEKFIHTLFWQRFRESNIFTKELISQIFYVSERMSRFSTLTSCVTVCEETKNSLSFGKRFGEINLQKSYFNVDFTKLLFKYSDRKNLATCTLRDLVLKRASCWFHAIFAKKLYFINVLNSKVYF